MKKKICGKLAVATIAGLCFLNNAKSAEMDYATPESQGVRSSDILDWIQAVETNFNAEGTIGALHGFVIVRHGKIIAEGSWKPFDTLEKTHSLFSHSKSFTSTAIGLLADDGLLDIDTRVVDIFPDELPEKISENLSMLRVRDLLTMNAGAPKDHRIDRSPDWLKAFFQKDFAKSPGTSFKYDSDATYVLSAIVEKISGKKLMDFLNIRLFKPIGIKKAWSTCSPQGIACGGWGMNMTTRELARFGQLYLQRGKWAGKQILSSQWVQLATSCHTASGWKNVSVNALGNGSNWERGYGFQFWRCNLEGFRADGAGGQLTLVYPDQDMVISVNAGLNNMAKEIALIEEFLVLRASKTPLQENEALSNKLEKRTKELMIKPISGTTEGIDKYLDIDFAISKNKRGIKGLRLVRSGNGYKIAFRARNFYSEFPVGIGKWLGGSVYVDPEKHEYLGALIGLHQIKTSGGIQSDGSFLFRGYLTGTTSFIQARFLMKDGVPAVEGRLWGFGGTVFNGTKAGERLEVPSLGDADDTYKFFLENEFGIRPVEKPDNLSFKEISRNDCYESKVLHRAIEISCKGTYAPFSFVVHSYEPKAKAKHPVFVVMNFPSRLKKDNFDPNGKAPTANCWPIGEITSRGFATVGFSYSDVAEDDPKKCFNTGVFKAFGPKKRKDTDWGALSAWAWAASRCVDWLETQSNIDTSRIAVVGHSRLGKTALWAGVTDKRFHLACVNNSGTSGAKLNRMVLPFSESIEDIYRNFPHWFSPLYMNFTRDDGHTMKYDQHNLAALIAPRKLAIGSGSLDHWAGPKAELETAVLASPAWDKLGVKGFGFGVRHHVRKGPHDITPEDWGHYMNALLDK